MESPISRRHALIVSAVTPRRRWCPPRCAVISIGSPVSIVIPASPRRCTAVWVGLSIAAAWGWVWFIDGRATGWTARGWRAVAARIVIVAWGRGATTVVFAGWGVAAAGRGTTVVIVASTGRVAPATEWWRGSRAVTIIAAGDLVLDLGR